MRGSLQLRLSLLGLWCVRLPPAHAGRPDPVVTCITLTSPLCPPPSTTQPCQYEHPRAGWAVVVPAAEAGSCLWGAPNAVVTVVLATEYLDPLLSFCLAAHHVPALAPFFCAQPHPRHVSSGSTACPLARLPLHSAMPTIALPISSITVGWPRCCCMITLCAPLSSHALFESPLTLALKPPPAPPPITHRLAHWADARCR